MITDVRMLESEDGNAFSTVVNWDQDPLTFWTRNKKHNAPNLQHQKHPSLSEEGKASKSIQFEETKGSRGRKVPIWSRKVGPLLLGIFCCAAHAPPRWRAIHRNDILLPWIQWWKFIWELWWILCEGGQNAIVRPRRVMLLNIKHHTLPVSKNLLKTTIVCISPCQQGHGLELSKYFF